ncbi:MAG: hypothetical protein N2662_06635 [Bacteroidales bacterium]|nr:hypothetical protein [Bacteroidales bacterium]
MHYIKKVYFFFILLYLSILTQKCKESIQLIYYGQNITNYDINMIIRLNQLQPGSDTSQAVALYQLKRTILFMHIADSLGIPVTDSILQLEAKRIAKQTLMPQRLDSIRMACGDSLSYIKYFILPQFVPRWLYSHFVWNKDIHKTQGDSALMLIEEWKRTGGNVSLYENLSGLGLQSLAQKYNFEYERLTVDSIQGIQPLKQNVNHKKVDAQAISSLPEKINWISSNQMESFDKNKLNQLMNNVLKKMHRGQVFPYPIELTDSFWIVQLIDFFDNKYFIGVIRISKIDFYTWLKKQGYSLESL